MTDDERQIRQTVRRFQKGVTRYGLIEDGDRILIGLSGGKDSLALLELMAERTRIFKPCFQVVAAHITMSNIGYESDPGYLQDFAQKVGVKYVCREAGFDASGDWRKSPCFLCSWNRRKALFQIAHEEKCNKIALGHHMDDILETLLMNITFQGTFSTMPPLLRMNKFDMTVIRPLCLVHESDLREWARIKGYRPQKVKCPHEHQSHRASVKQILRQLEEMNPEARYSLWGSMTNVQTELLPPKSE